MGTRVLSDRRGEHGDGRCNNGEESEVPIDGAFIRLYLQDD
jgi:hypothetical protein